MYEKWTLIQCIIQRETDLLIYFLHKTLLSLYTRYTLNLFCHQGTLILGIVRQKLISWSFHTSLSNLFYLVAYTSYLLICCSICQCSLPCCSIHRTHQSVLSERHTKPVVYMSCTGWSIVLPVGLSAVLFCPQDTLICSICQTYWSVGLSQGIL